MKSRAASKGLPHVLSLAADSRDALRARLAELTRGQETLDAARFAEWIRHVNESLGKNPGPYRLALTATNAADVRRKLNVARSAIDDESGRAAIAGLGIFVGQVSDGKLAITFPGQGGQYANMLSELAEVYPVIEQV